MEFSDLLAICPLDGRYFDKLHNLRELVSEYGLIAHRIFVEVRWLNWLCTTRQIKEVTKLNKTQQEALESIFTQFRLQDAIQIKSIEKTTNHDVKAIEYFLRDKLNSKPDFNHLVPFIHFACTSEDINNLAYALILKKAREKHLLPHLYEIVNDIKSKAQEYQTIAMLSRTHGQTATPTTLGKEFANVIARLERQIDLLEKQPILGKFNGAVGNYNAHHIAYPKVDWQSISQKFVESLGVEFNPFTTQIEPHDYVAEYLQTLSRINTILLDFSKDMWAYISIGYFNQKQISHEVGSSTMPHKINPIDFENAEGNLGIANALGQHLSNKLPISRWQRDLSDSTVIRNIGCVIGYSVLAYISLQKGLKKIIPNQEQIHRDLAPCWEIMAEPIQTVMRRYGIANAYEQLKSFSRGKSITAESIRQFISQLELPKEAKDLLLELTPENYIGYATTLTEKILTKKH